LLLAYAKAGLLSLEDGDGHPGQHPKRPAKARNFSYVCDGPVRKKRVKEVKKNCGESRNILQRCYRRLWIAEVEAPAAECDAQLIISEYIAPFGGINLAGL